MNVLIIGGNLFFGKRLVKLLIEDNHQITMLNRQNRADDFGDKIKRIKCDRLNKSALKKAVTDTHWDIVFDQVCYDYDTAKNACEIFEGKTRHYIYTSSQSVYGTGREISEDYFRASTYQMMEKADRDKNYAEAKRQAEYAFEKYSRFPIAQVRFPIVIGPDDYTNRFNFHIKRIQNEEEIFFPNLDAEISFITSEDAARSLYHIALNHIEGPINCCNSNSISIRDFIQIIVSQVGKEMKLAKKSNEHNQSPYGIEQHWFMSNKKLTESGLLLGCLKEKIRELVRVL
jgi:nucleoside-diphosphate-sugar epimerase